MLLNNGQDTPEAYLRTAVGVVDNEGGFLRDAPNALRQFDPNLNYVFRDDLSVDELKAAINNGPAIVSVKTELVGGSHALVVDGFQGDRIIIRDPLPQGSGSSYTVSLESFLKAWKGKAVFLP